MNNNLQRDAYFAFVTVRQFLVNTMREYEQLEQHAKQSGKNSYIVNRWEKRKLETVRELGKVDKFMKEKLGAQ